MTSVINVIRKSGDNIERSASWCSSQTILREKISLADKSQTSTFIYDAYRGLVESYCTDGGLSSLQRVDKIINEWRVDSIENTCKKQSLVTDVRIIRGDVNALTGWENNLINHFSTRKEIELFILYKKHEETLIRVVIDKIDASLIREYNKIFISEKQKETGLEKIDFLVIDTEINSKKVYPDDSIILAFSE